MTLQSVIQQQQLFKLYKVVVVLLLLARLIDQYCFARQRLSASVVCRRL